MGQGYSFGEFTVDRAAYRLTRAGKPVEITPKLLDVLLHLLDHAGTLVTKEDLLDALWPGANVTDNALTQAVSELRQALGDDASAPRFIKTVARRGYRFVAPLVAIVDIDALPVDDPPPIDDHAIAVLDFTNVSGDADAAWLYAGIAETVSADLHAIGRFRVIDRRRVVDVASGEALADAKVDGRLDEIQMLIDPQPSCAVTGVPDEVRGERLVAFYTDTALAPADIWERLCRTDLPRLWLPKREDIRRIDAIPSLGTSKVDLRAVRQLAAKAAEAVAS